MTTAQRKIEWIESQLSKGLTVALTTCTKSTQFKSKHYEAFKAAGTPLLKIGNAGNLLMAVGRKYVVADGCKVSAF